VYNGAVGITNSETTANLTLYPNPTTGILNIQCTTNDAQWKNAEIQLFDIYGRRLQVVEVTSDVTQIDLSRYSTGIYVVKLVNEGKVVSVRKVVKQ
jgi:hypothetical protein